MKYLFLLGMLIISATGNSQVNYIDPSQIPSRPYLLPWDRIIQPAAMHILFGFENNESHAMDAALSPDGKWLAVMERSSIVFFNTDNNSIVFTLTNNSHGDLIGGMNTYSGIKWYRGDKGLEVFWGITGKDDKSFLVSAKWDGRTAKFHRFFEYNPIPPAYLALTNEFLINKEVAGEYLYVVLNGSDRLIKQEINSGDTIWMTNPGVAPYGITMAAGKIYVTNWAGRNPEAGDTQVAGVPWGSARVDNSKGGSTRESTVAVIDPYDGTILKQILTGLHSNEIVSDKRGRFVYVTNSNSDNVSVIDTRKDEISETISVRLQPEINPYFGDSPNGLCLSMDERTLYVANGMDNALAVISLGSKASIKAKVPESKVTGFIPTGAYPSSVCISSSNHLYVSNLEAIGATMGVKDKASGNRVYNSHRMHASISIINVPDILQLKAFTDTVVALNNLSRSLSAREEPRKNIEPKPVPERIGEPSVFKHVLYIIKENRTYDQVLGDMKQGDGEPSLCIFGEKITPNTHRLSEEFMLLDNFHVAGKSSAEGHQWTDAAIVTDYIEKNMQAWFRSYPHVQNDALVYAPTGFLWDNAVRNGKKVRIYGEASFPEFSTPKTWTDVYQSFIKGEKIDFRNITTIDPVRPLLSESYPSYGDHEFPDIMRADAFIKELKNYESMEGDQLPELMIMALPNDHTAGTRPGYPTPRAMVADNDLALGQIVQAVSGSRFWKNTVIFVIEDDSQMGWDHVTAFRTVGIVISPYSRLRTTVHTYYTQPSVVRTIEQILGLPPMNIQDAIAAPMSDCFEAESDLQPYKFLPNNIPLDEMNKGLTSLSGKALHYARKSLLPEFDGIDSGNDALFNRILWFYAKGDAAYPSKLSGSKNMVEDDD